MKIAVNTRLLLPNRLEGIGWFSYEVLQRWVTWHPEHQFIFCFDRPYDEQFIFSDNVTPLVVFPQARHPFLFYWWFEWSIPKVLKRQKADIFYSPDGFGSLRATTPTLLTIHDIAWRHYPKQVPYLYRKHYEYYMPRFAQKADRITTVSAYSKQDIIQELNIDKNKIDIVYAGSNAGFQPVDDNTKVQTRQKYAKNCPYFLYIGSIHPRKNLVRLLQAFDIFKSTVNSNAKLLLAGRMAWQSGDVGQTLENMTHRQEVIPLGYVPTEELFKIAASAYSIVYPSVFEGFGIPILEAMQCNVPVITSETSSMPEVLGDAGILINPYDINSIADGLLKYWQDKAFRQAAIDKGQAQREKFSWDKTAQAMWHSLEKML